MNTGEVCRLSTTILCIILLLHYSISQPVALDSNEENDFSMKLSSDSESSDESRANLYLVHTESNQINQPNSSEPVRRANFWKRANFWRKRANFWRRDLAI